jgi:hypothetical protein
VPVVDKWGITMAPLFLRLILTKTKTFVKKSSLTKIIIDWGGLFYDINLKNNGAIVIPRFSILRG